MKLEKLNQLVSIAENADIRLYSISIDSIYELARYFKASVSATENKTETSFKVGLVNITLTDLPF